MVPVMNRVNSFHANIKDDVVALYLIRLIHIITIICYSDNNFIIIILIWLLIDFLFKISFLL